MTGKVAGARPWLVLAGGDFAYKGIMAVYWVLLARVMSVDGLGTVALANAIAMPAYVIVDAGLTQMLIRDYSESGGMLRAHMRRVRMRVIVGILLVLPLACLGYAMGDREAAAAAVALMSLAYFFDFSGQLMLAPARAASRMEPDAVVRFIQALGTVAISLFLIQADLKSAGWIALASAVAYCLALYPAARVWRASERWADHPADGAEETIETTPVAVGTVVMTVSGRVDSLIVQVILGPAALATYTIAYKLIEVARLVPGALARVVLAHSSAETESPERSVYDPRDHLRISVILSGLATLVLVAFGPQLIGLLFGSDYGHDAVGTIRVMALALVPFSILTIGSMYAVGTGRAGLYARIAFENLIAMAILVPVGAAVLDLPGAAAGMLISDLYAAARFWRLMHRPNIAQVVA